MHAEQRWRHGRSRFIPPGRRFEPKGYEVALIRDDRTAKQFVTLHHYSSAYPAARWRVGLYHGQELVGVAVFSHPCNDRVLAVLPCGTKAGVELGRMVLLDDVLFNGESWFLARAFDLVRREGVEGVVSFSDPMPRRRVDGGLVMPGHWGQIYQASNAVYLGRARAQYLQLLPDGTVFSHRAEQKVRKLEQGYRYAAARLERFGADPLDVERPVEWLRAWTARLCRRVRHAGNHRYAWAVDRRLRHHLPDSLPYPRQIDPEAPVTAARTRQIAPSGSAVWPSERLSG